MSRVISNAEYEAALSTIDNIKIMDAAAAIFRNKLDKDELYRCKLIALWDTLRTWRPTGRKFTSFLYKKVQWECIRSLKQQSKHKTVPMFSDVSDAPINLDILDILDGLTPDLKDMMHKRYMQSMTLREISQYYDACPETIRRKLLQAIKILQNLYLKPKNGV